MTEEVKNQFELMLKMRKLSILEIESKKISLSDSFLHLKKKTLFLDLDDTLIHTLHSKWNYRNRKVNLSMTECISYWEPEQHKHSVLKILRRPGLREFLNKMSQLFELIIFTASQKPYADVIINFLDPNHTFFSGILYRNSCVVTNVGYVKDLRIIQNRKPQDMICVDNNTLSFANNLSNGVHIETFFGQEGDDALHKLGVFLTSLADVDSIPISLSKVYGLTEHFTEFSAQHLNNKEFQYLIQCHKL